MCQVLEWIYILMTTERFLWRRVGSTFTKHLDPKIVLHHRCYIRRLVNLTLPRSRMPTGSEQVVSQVDAHSPRTQINPFRYVFLKIRTPSYCPLTL